MDLGNVKLQKCKNLYLNQGGSDDVDDVAGDVDLGNGKLQKLQKLYLNQWRSQGGQSESNIQITQKTSRSCCS